MTVFFDPSLTSDRVKKTIPRQNRGIIGRVALYGVTTFRVTGLESTVPPLPLAVHLY